MIFRSLFVLLFLFSAATVSATSIFDRLSDVQSDASLSVTLTLPVDSLLVQRPSVQHAAFGFYDQEGLLNNWSVKVSPRGKFRRHKCDHAPLKIDFAKKELRAAGLADHDKYKLVTACFHGTASDRLVRKEYLAYRAYQLFTPTSYRVRLLDVTYRDANGNHPDRKAAAFMIENTGELAARRMAERVHLATGLPAESFDPTAEATHALFQYLIGNTDWSNTLAQNMKTLKRRDGSLLPVGYDFDFSGWVKAPYSSPRKQLGQRSVVHRVYLGFHQPDDVLNATAELFLAKKEALVALIENAPVHRADRRYLLRYTARFYNGLKKIRDRDIMMIYQNLRGNERKLVPFEAMPEDFAVME